MRYKSVVLAGASLVFTFTTAGVFSQSVEEGKKMLYYERYASAEDILSKVIAGNLNNGEAYYTLAEVYNEQGRTKSADSLLNTIPASLAGDPNVKIARGYLLLKNGKKEEAAKLFTEVTGSLKKKDQADALVKIAKIYVDVKDGDANYALELLAQAEEKDKKNPDLYMTRGDAYRKLANGGDAIKSYMTALDYDNKLARANYMIGRIYLSQDNKAAYVENFEKAVEIDPAYKPALYELYYYHYFRDVFKAEQYLDKYVKSSDPSPEHDYIRTDLMFVSENYDQAIAKANELIGKYGANAEPRLYKLIAYSYDAKKDSVKAKEALETYFTKQVPANVVSKDYEFMSSLNERFGEEDKALANLEKAAAIDTSSEQKAAYITKIAAAYKKKQDRSKEAYWLGEAYKAKKEPSNTDLYNWGSAHYFAKEFGKADSVFALYSAKYPDQIYGPFWQARSNAAIDTSMELGLAVPHYTRLIEVASKDTVANKSVLIQSYGYLAAYNANVAKDYGKAVEYLDQILVLQPGNNDAKANRDVLEKLVNSRKASTDTSAAGGSNNKSATGNGGSSIRSGDNK